MSREKLKTNAFLGKTDGILLVNKPSGPTSHDIIDQVRKITGTKKVGHAGTLDPFASGLLLVAVGDATKLLKHYVGLDKEYKAVLRLGAVSDTYDRTGKISKFQFPSAAADSKFPITKSQIQKVLKSFVGKQKQVPPMYSAKKIGGKKLYELAREGKTIKRKAEHVEIFEIKLLSLKGDLLHMQCRVSSGTYIRTLAHDIGEKLGTGAYLEELKRTRIGDFRLEEAIRVIVKESAASDDRSNPSNAPGVASAISSGQRGIRTASLCSSSARNGTGTTTNWGRHLIPVKTVLVSGTFDGVHEGHRDYFRQARSLAEKSGAISKLVCIVGRASIVEKIKGARPHLLAKERIKLLKQCPEIDQVFLGAPGADRDIFDFVASLKPDIIALGYDQKAYTRNLKGEMRKRKLDVSVARLKPFKTNEFKNSIIKKTRPNA